MKIFDRYILRSFVKNYLLSSVVLIGLYIAIDMVFNFDELARAATASDGSDGSAVLFALRLVTGIVDFYFFQIFAVFVQLSGVIPVVAATFTLVRLMRFNELTAMLAAGVPLLRLAAPVFLGGVVLSALLIVDQELIIPNITHKLERDHDDLGRSAASSFFIGAMEDGSGNLLSAARYTPPQLDEDGEPLPATLERMDIIEFSAERRARAHIQAHHATYDSQRRLWLLVGGKRQTGLQPGDPVTTSVVNVWQTDIGPQEIGLYRKAKYADLLSIRQINALLEHPRNYGMIPLLRVKHWRMVQPLANIVLLLLAIPCVLTREPTAIRLAAAKTVLMTGACLISFFIAHQLAGKPPTDELANVWPALVLWTPLFVFGPLAVFMLDRIRS